MEKLKLLYTDIGRGHPFYLDGIVEELHRNGGTNSVYVNTSVFDLSSGLNLKTWQLVRALYMQGGRDNLISKVYKRLRKNNNYEDDSLALRLLGRDIKKILLYDYSQLVVAHPILVSILRNRKKLYYQHGELIAPQETVTSGAEFVFVPTEDVAEIFLSRYQKEQIIVTGLCIEPSIARIAKNVYQARLQRLESDSSLVGCFISSGAEPERHVNLIIGALLSHLNQHGRAVLFVKKDGRLSQKMNTHLHSLEVAYCKINSLDAIPDELPPLTIVEFRNRKEENRLTSYFFHSFDFFVSPSHERSNWAVGLGLPMYITSPSIGPYAPLNEKFLLKSKTASLINDISDAKRFAFRLKKMHIEGILKQQSHNGWDRYPIDGFQEIVSFLKNNL